MRNAGAVVSAPVAADLPKASPAATGAPRQRPRFTSTLRDKVRRSLSVALIPGAMTCARVTNLPRPDLQAHPTSLIPRCTHDLPHPEVRAQRASKDAPRAPRRSMSPRRSSTLRNLVAPRTIGRAEVPHGIAVRVEDRHLRRACGQFPDRRDQVRRRVLHRLVGDAVGGRPLARRHRQRCAAAVRAASRRTPGRPDAPLRPWARALLLGLHRGPAGVCAGRGRLLLRGRDPHHRARADPQRARHLCRARPVDRVRRLLVVGGAEGVPHHQGQARLFRGGSKEQGSERVHRPVRGHRGAPRPVHRADGHRRRADARHAGTRRRCLDRHRAGAGDRGHRAGPREQGPADGRGGRPCPAASAPGDRGRRSSGARRQRHRHRASGAAADRRRAQPGIRGCGHRTRYRGLRAAPRRAVAIRGSGTRGHVHQAADTGHMGAAPVLRWPTDRRL
jgi:hypothetical protein